MQGRFLDTMTWDEAERALTQFRVVLLPLGARLKEHGLHLPLNNDFLMAEYLTRRVAERMPVLVLPTLPFHYFPAFVEYPGSVTLTLDTSRALVLDICRSLARHGARRFYVLNTGVSTDRALAPARETLRAEGIWLEYTRLLHALGPTEAVLRQQPRGTHADEMETSMMLYIAPEVVHMERAQVDCNEERGGGGGLTRNADAKDGVYSPTGAWGDPTLATVEKGRILVEALVEHLVADVEALGSDDYAPREDSA